MQTLTLRSPAKLNLYLKVTNKRNDGYYNIVTLFERINLYDDVQLKLRRDSKIRIFCKSPQVPKGPSNLVYKVAKLLQDDFALANGVDIKITKRIPVAAGLAGGSSNAAATLLGLNKIWKLSLTDKELWKYAQKIGADVSFFLYNCSWAVGTKRGDQIERISISRKFWHILVVPRRKMSTQDVYKGLKWRSPRGLRRKNGGRTNMLTKTRDGVNILIHNLRNSNIYKAGSFLSNDLESSSFRLYPNLSELKQRVLKLNNIGAALSGSGPAVFGLTKSRKQAEFLKSILQRRYSQVFVVRTL